MPRFDDFLCSTLLTKCRFWYSSSWSALHSLESFITCLHWSLSMAFLSQFLIPILFCGVTYRSGVVSELLSMIQYIGLIKLNFMAEHQCMFRFCWFGGLFKPYAPFVLDYPCMDHNHSLTCIFQSTCTGIVLKPRSSLIGFNTFLIFTCGWHTISMLQINLLELIKKVHYLHPTKMSQNHRSPSYGDYLTGHNR